MPAWLRYTLLRLLVLAVPLAILLFLGVQWFWATLVSTVIAFCVSFIFFRGSRDEVARDWANRRPQRTRDDIAEDDELDAASSADDGADGERRAES